MRYPRDPFSPDDPVSPGDPGDDAVEFTRPHSSPQPPPTPRPAPPAPPAPPLVPPEAHHAEAFGAEGHEAQGYGAEGHGAEDVAPRAEPGYPPSGSQVLFESWEPPHDPADPWWDIPWTSEFDDLLAEPSARVPAESPAGPPLLREPGGGSGRRPGGAPWDGPRHARPERGRRRRHWGGAILALTGALALAGAVPLGILGVRTLADRPAPTLTAAPLSNGSPISAPPSAAASAAASAPASAPAGAPSQLSQGQTAAGPGPSASASSSGGAGSGGAAGAAKAATFALTAGPGCRAVNGVIVFPFHAPAGDGWQPGTADRTGPCGASFSYSLLANVRNASGDWHDHYAWIFHTGKQVASCTLSFYVPPSAHANSSAFYWFSAGSDNPQNRMADFSVDQQADQGQWVTKGPFTFPGGTVLVELTDRGVGPVQDTVEAGVLQLRCV
jgi:hypothetical protein